MALDDVDLAADGGAITGLIGPNGAGKTTLFNVICGLQAPSRGRVRIAGRDVTRTPPYRRARQGLARTFQRLELFGLLTVRENVHVAARQASVADADAVSDRLLARLDLTEVAGQRADRLPTGQARVVELARALATKPLVLLLDEPASGQDDTETARFADVLREVAADGVAVVLVEHDIQLVMDVCEQIHVLDLGRVLATGTPTEVRQDAAVLAAYLGQVS
jgi:branched-chain amino acid transport system ATP-binding protein